MKEHSSSTEKTELSGDARKIDESTPVTDHFALHVSSLWIVDKE